MKYRPNLGAMFAVLFAASVMATFTVSIAFAHEYSPAFRFHSSSVNADDRTTNYSSEVSTAIDDYDDNTDMTWVDADPAVIIYLEGSWGATGWVAGAQALSNSVPCFDWPDLVLTGDCDDDENKSDFSYIYLNTHYQDDLDEYIDTIVLHEPAHVLGMNHTGCSTASIVKWGSCSNQLTTLQSHDTDHIDDWY